VVFPVRHGRFCLQKISALQSRIVSPPPWLLEVQVIAPVALAFAVFAGDILDHFASKQPLDGIA
jgi:hypothetical protein